MDPDLVRQQEEEEAASRNPSRKSLSAPRMTARIEPVLPMTAPSASGLRVAAEPAFEPALPPEPAAPASSARRAPGWGAALGGATSVTLGTLAGLIGGLMLGVKLQLVPWQGGLIGTLAGLFLGWQLAAVVLRRRGAAGGRALGRAVLPAFMAYLALAGAMFLMPLLLAVPGGPALAVDVTTFWKAVAGGALASVLLASLPLRRALRKGWPQPG